MKAIENANDLRAFLEDKLVTDYSENGKLTSKNFSCCRDFAVYDGGSKALEFHDYSDEMWVTEANLEFAEYCEEQYCLKTERPAT